MNELRRFGRRPTRFKVTCWAADRPARRLKGYGMTISLGGIGLKLKERIEPGSIVRIRIAKAFWQEPIEAMGRVAWQADLDSFGMVAVGVRFTDAEWAKIEEILFT